MLTLLDWFDLFLHFFTLSLLAVGGAITTVPELHRYLVVEKGWLSATQLSSSIALAQAAPGPNVLFIALLGWHVGIHAAGSFGWLGFVYGLLGMLTTMVGMLLPSTTLTFYASRWLHSNRERLWVQACRRGLTPVVIALLLATIWLLSTAPALLNALLSGGDLLPLLLALAFVTVTALLIWKKGLHPLWFIASGALLGALGWF